MAHIFTEHYNAPVPFESGNTSKPKVLIAGGGIGGLTLGILLQKAGVPFKIFERSDVNQLGNPLGPLILIIWLISTNKKIKNLILSFYSS